MWEWESRGDPHFLGPRPNLILRLHPSENVQRAKGIRLAGKFGSLKAGPEDESAMEVS